MNRTITFRELVRLIHPDVNPHITDAGGKMNTAKMYRNEPEELYKLAVRWGLMGGVPRPEPQPQPRQNQRPFRTTERRWETPQEPRYVWREFPQETPYVGGDVFVLTKGRMRVSVVKVTPARVYFYHQGRRTFANRKNVTVARQVRV